MKRNTQKEKKLTSARMLGKCQIPVRKDPLKRRSLLKPKVLGITGNPILIWNS